MSHGNPQKTLKALQPLQLHPSHYVFRLNYPQLRLCKLHPLQLHPSHHHFRLNCPHVLIHKRCSWIVCCDELHIFCPQLTISSCVWWVHQICIMGATKPANTVIHEVQNGEDVTGKNKAGINDPLQWNFKCDSSWTESHSYQNILRETCFKAKWIQFINHHYNIKGGFKTIFRTIFS